MHHGYVETDIHISDKQKHSIASAVSAGSGVKLKFTYAQLQKEENAKILLTKTQHNRLAKAFASGKGIVVMLSKKQLNSMKIGGFLPMLLAGIASALAPMLFNRLLPDNSKDGN